MDKWKDYNKKAKQQIKKDSGYAEKVSNVFAGNDNDDKKKKEPSLFSRLNKRFKK